MSGQEEQLVLPGFEEIEPTGAALLRNFRETGEQWEATREIIALMGDRGHYVYNINLRWPRKPAKDVLMIVKMFTEEGSYVAFHSGFTWTHLITSFAARVRAGAVNWLVDEYPPDEWVEWYTVLHNLPRIRR